MIERSVVLGNGHERLGIDDLPPELQGLSISDELPKGSFHDAVRNFKRELVRVALEMHNGNKLKAAKELGISRAYLHRLLNQLEVAGGREDDAELLEKDKDAEESSAESVREDVSRAIEPAKTFRSAVRIA